MEQMRERDWQKAVAETNRLQRELDITNADHVALWLEANTIQDEPMSQCASWLACRIVEAHERALSLMQPEIDRRVAEEKTTLFERLRTPSDAACVGLARDIMMWLDMDPKTPRALFKHLERIGSEIPQWLRDEPEMQSLDHVPSKATRCAIIWQAMIDKCKQENSDA